MKEEKILKKKTFLDKGKADYKAAKMLMQDADDELLLCLAGYHLQQAVEHAIKYQLELNGIEYPWKHELDQLISLAKKENAEIFMTDYISDHSEMLSTWEARTRYITNYSIEREKIDKAIIEVGKYLEGCEQYIKENLVFSEENEQEENNNIEIEEDRDDR